MNKQDSNEAWQRLCLVLKQKIESSKLTHQDIADSTGIDRGNITRIINGQYTPKASTLIGIGSTIDKEFVKKLEKLIDSL